MSAEHLDRLQRWMQAVITHPDGVVEGAQDARATLDVGIEEVVAPSAGLNPERRVAIYSSMYFDRLIDIMGEDFPAVHDAAGEVEFRILLRDYLVACPSTHFSLNELGRRFPGFLRERQDKQTHGAFLAELAALERTIQEVFDAPRSEALDSAAIEAVDADSWATACLRVVPALRLLSFEHATNDWYRAFRDDSRRPDLTHEPSWLALYRREYRVWRLPITREQHAILQALTQGVPLAATLEAAASLPNVDLQELAGSLGAWFREWAGLGFFAEVSSVNPRQG